MQKKIKEYLEQFYQDTDGNWVKKDTPTSGYGRSMPHEAGQILDFLKGLLDEDTSV